MSDDERGDDGLDSGKAPLLDHLIELRRRLLWSALALATHLAYASFRPADLGICPTAARRRQGR